VNLDNVTVTAKIVFNSILEEQGFNRKKDLFEKTFAKKIAVVWKYQPRPVDNSAQAIDSAQTTATPDSTVKEPPQSSAASDKAF
jgi:hypothetical protein